jgi:hypothetical protein
MRAVRYQVWCSADEGRGDGVDGNDGVVASDSEGDNEVRLDVVIFFPSSSAILLVPNGVYLRLKTMKPGEIPTSSSVRSRGPVRRKKG